VGVENRKGGVESRKGRRNSNGTGKTLNISENSVT